MELYVDQLIHATPMRVANVMFDPTTEPEWIANTQSVEVLTPGPLAVGSRIRRVGGMLGRSFAWVSEVTVLEPDRRLEMKIIEGPFHGTVIYETVPGAGGAVAIVHAKPDPNAPNPAPKWAPKREMLEDLKRLGREVMHPHA